MENRGMLHSDASLGHHLFQIPEAQLQAKTIEGRADHGSIKMTALEHATLRP
jgi:hypothetical protein